MQRAALIFTLLLFSITVSAANRTLHTKSKPALASESAMIVDANSGKSLYEKNSTRSSSIASITKLMTAMVVLDAKPSMNEFITITDADVDHLKNTHSRLPVGTRMTRKEMLNLALMSSENRAASALSRSYAGGRVAFMKSMNKKAISLGMMHTHFDDPTGLMPSNVSTASDLVKMVKAASRYQTIHTLTTTAKKDVKLASKRAPLEYKNTNALVRGGKWDIQISKTGYINEAGHCLVMMADIKSQPVIFVLLESQGKYSPVGDATRIKAWVESQKNTSQIVMR